MSKRKQKQKFEPQISQRELARLNGKFGDAFGWREDADRGQLPWICWMRTRDLYYFHKEGVQTITPPGKLIAVVVPRYERFCEVDRCGDCWVLANWQPPKEQALWALSIGAEFPWFRQGQYYALTDTKLPVGVDPDEKITERYLKALKEQVAKTHSEFHAEAKIEGQSAIEEKQKEFDAEYDDWWPAFDNVRASEDKLGQSRGGHVSFGGID